MLHADIENVVSAGAGQPLKDALHGQVFPHMLGSYVVSFSRCYCSDPSSTLAAPKAGFNYPETNVNRHVFPPGACEHASMPCSLYPFPRQACSCVRILQWPTSVPRCSIHVIAQSYGCGTCIMACAQYDRFTKTLKFRHLRLGSSCPSREPFGSNRAPNHGY